MIIFLDEFGTAEEGIARSYQLSVQRMSSSDAVKPETWAKVGSSFPNIVRGKGIDGYLYKQIWKAAASKGCALVGDFNDFRLGTDEIEKKRVFGNYYPKTTVFPKQTLGKEIASTLRRGDFPLPAFVRCELGSAAKYKGISNCFLTTYLDKEVANHKDLIDQYFPMCSQIFFKELIFDPSQVNSFNEVRFLSFCGNHFIDRQTKIPTPSIRERLTPRLNEAAGNLFLMAKALGYEGAYSLDLIINESDEIKIVEFKNLSDATISSPEIFYSRVLNIYYREAS